MKRPTKQLLDDLAGDSVSPEFRAALLDTTLRTARRRKRVRQLTWSAGITLLMAIMAVMIQIRTSESSLRETPKSISVAAGNNSQTTKPDSANPTTVEVQTRESDQPREINDEELLAMAGDKPVALIPRGAHKSELVFLSTP